MKTSIPNCNGISFREQQKKLSCLDSSQEIRLLENDYIQYPDTYNDLVSENQIVDNDQYFQQMQEYENLLSIDPDSSPTPESSTPRAREFKRLGIQTVNIERDQLILGKYLPEPLVSKMIASSGKKAVILGAGLGLGKSTVMSSMMNNSKTARGLAVSHRVKLIEQICNTFDAESYQDIKRPDHDGTMPNRVGTTIHSLDTIHDLDLLANATNGEILAADEFESIANEMNQYKTLRNPHKAIAALKAIAKQSKLFIAADAHPTSQSVHLLSVLGFETSDILFINVERPELEGYKIQIITQGEDKDITPFTAMINDAKAKLKQGNKITIVGLSREKLKQAYRELSPCSLNSIMVNSQTNEKEVSRLNPETYEDFDLVVLSPSMSTGISFDGGDSYNHADEVFVHASNYAGTGSPYDALQALFRDRKPKNITVFYEAGDDPLNGADKIAAYAKNRYSTLDEIFRNNQELRNAYNFNRPDDEAVNSFLICNQIKQSDDKLNFIGILTAELIQKGAKVSTVETGAGMAGEVTPESMRELKDAIRAEYLESVGSAIKITEDTDESEIDSDSLGFASTRKYIETETCTDFDSMSNPDRAALIESVIPEHGAGVMMQVWNIERAFSDPLKIKAIVDASLGGKACFEGDKARFLEGNQNSKIYWEYKNKYVGLGLKALGIESESGTLNTTIESIVISNESIRSRKNPAYSLYSSLAQNPVNSIRSGLVGVLTTPQQIKKNPARFIVGILQSLFDVKATKARKRDSWTINVTSIEKVINIVNSRTASGVNGIDDYYQKIQDWVDDAPRRKSLMIQKNNNTTQTVSNAETSIRELMVRFERSDLIDDALEWLEPYESRINSGKIKHSGLGVMLLKFIADSPVDNFAKGSDTLKS